MLFSNVCISQGSVATRLRWGENFHTFGVTNFILFLAVKKFKHQLTFGKVITKDKVPPFYGTLYTDVIVNIIPTD